MVEARRVARLFDPSRPARRAIAKLPGAGLVDVVPRTMSYLTGSQLRRFRSNSRPVARPSPQFAAQVALDEAMLAAIASTRMPPASAYPRLGEEVVAANALFTAEGWVEHPRTYHVEPTPLTDVRSVPAKSRGVRFEHVEWESGFAVHAGEPGAERWMARDRDRTAHAWVLRHRGAPRPWIVCVHGMGMGTPIADLSAFKAGELFVERGFNVAMPVLPAHGPRRVRGARLPDVPGADHLDLVHMLAQALWDVRRLLTWVRAQDAPAIAVHGISLGGYVAALVAAYDDALAGVVAGVPVSDFERLERHHATGAERRRGFAHRLFGEDAQRVFSVVSPLALQPALPPERLAIYAGLGDRVATSAQAQLLWEHWGKPDIHWYPGGHIGFMWSSRTGHFVRERLDAMLAPALV